MPLQILGKAFHRRIPIRDIVGEGLPEHGGEIAIQFPAQCFRSARALRGSGRRDEGCGAERNDFTPGSQRIGLAEGARSNEQFIEHHTERIDIGCRGRRLATQLLRTRIGASHHQRTRSLRRSRIVKQFGDAEIKQFGNAGIRHQDVARL